MYPNPPGTSFAPNSSSPGDSGDSPFSPLFGSCVEIGEVVLVLFEFDLLSYWHKWDADLRVQFPHGCCLSHYYNINTRV